jgi:hypothetical protein
LQLNGNWPIKLDVACCLIKAITMTTSGIAIASGESLPEIDASKGLVVTSSGQN